MNKLKCIIIYGFPESENDKSYDKHWMPWTKKQLEKLGIETYIPDMPTPWNPNYESWKGEFEKIDIGENTILIGWSGGCSFLVRWLGESQKKVKKLILIAPWKIPSKDFTDGENEMYDFEINKDIKNNINQFIIFTSSDEEKDGKTSVKIFNETLNGKLIELKEKGHYTIGDMGTEEFPELIEEIIK